MSDDLVIRLKSCARDCGRLGDEVDAAFFNEAATALTEARAEIERLNARIDSFTEDRVFHESQASKLRRLEDLVRDGAARATALESELSTLRARASELAGENTNLRNDLVQRGMAEESLHEARCLEISDLIKTRLLGVAPDDQDLVLEDSDWAHIIQALERVAP